MSNLVKPRATRAAGLALGVAVSLAAAPAGGAGEPTAPASPRDLAFWRAIAAADGAVPEGTSAPDLVEELSAYLASPDPELRDRLAYSISALWIQRGLLDPETQRRLVARLCRQLSTGLGESGDDGIFLRSFSALSLSLLARRDLAAPFLGAEGHQALLGAALSYFAGERDLRAYGGEKGWIHATAHTADLLKFLGRSPHLRPEDATRIFAAIEAKLDAAGFALGQGFSWGESEQLADAAAPLVLRDMLDPKELDSSLARSATAAREVWKDSPLVDPGRYAALRNRQAFLSRLHFQLSLAANPSPAAQEARSRVLATLARM